MATYRLPSGCCVSTTNPSVISQYLKYGAVEITEPPIKIEEPVKVEEPVVEKKATTRKTKKTE